MKKIIIVLIAALINFLAANCSAFAEDFYIKKYDVNMEVTEDRVVKINENIDVVFNKRSHGIFRNIPFTQEIKRADGSKKLVKSKIKNICVSEQYKTSIDSNKGDIVLKIGNPNSYVTGEHSYSISYDYYIGNYSPNDEFYFNIIGTQWSVEIEKANFYIQMPKEFNPDDMGISIGRYGTAGFKDGDAVYSTNGKDIQGHTKRKLNSKEGITIRILLPDNYFTSKNGSETDSTLMFLLTIAGIIILTATAFTVWYIYGRDDHVTPVVNFYPPKGRNSAEVGVEYRGAASEKEVVSLIFYLASKGYLEISDDCTSFTLTKIKEYDGSNPVEKKLMDALFEYGGIVSQYTLEHSTIFYKQCEDIQCSLNKIRNFIFDKNACSLEKIIISVVCVLGISVLILFSLFDYSFDIMGSAMGLIYFQLFAILIIVIVLLKPASNKVKCPFLIAGAFFFLFPLILMCGGHNSPCTFNPAVVFTGITGMVISLVCLANMPKRNKRGRLALGQVLGFKKFLEAAEKRRIESLIRENPNYCFDVLAFAYVLDVSDVWVKKFENMVKEPPNWYHSSHGFNTHSFCRISRAIERVSVPTTTNGGIKSSSGRGGFSGGGHGGGGGGSW